VFGGKQYSAPLPPTLSPLSPPRTDGQRIIRLYTQKEQRGRSSEQRKEGARAGRHEENNNQREGTERRIQERTRIKEM
jgi:hypothetical protein